MTTTTTDSVYGKAYGGSAPENYQRYFVPVIGGPFAEDLIAKRRSVPANACSMLRAARVSSRASRRSASARAARSPRWI